MSPTRLRAGRAIRIRRPMPHATLHTRAREQRRVNRVVMVTPVHVVKRARCPTELAHIDHQRLVEQGLLRIGLRRNPGKILEQ